MKWRWLSKSVRRNISWAINNRDKAKILSDTIHEVLSNCGADCKNCVLEDLCDELDILFFKLFQLG